MTSPAQHHLKHRKNKQHSHSLWSAIFQHNASIGVHHWGWLLFKSSALPIQQTWKKDVQVKLTNFSSHRMTNVCTFCWWRSVDNVLLTTFCWWRSVDDITIPPTTTCSLPNLRLLPSATPPFGFLFANAFILLKARRQAIEWVQIAWLTLLQSKQCEIHNDGKETPLSHPIPISCF